MKVKDIMTRNVEVARPDETIQSVARRMAGGDFGFMPVVEDGRVVGTITDRDLTVRALAEALSPTTTVAQVMTNGSSTLRADDNLHEVLDKMGEERLRRMPVLDDQHLLVGVVSIGDLTRKAGKRRTGDALEEISRPAGTGIFT